MNTENNLQESTEQALTIPVVMPRFILCVLIYNEY